LYLVLICNSLQENKYLFILLQKSILHSLMCPENQDPCLYLNKHSAKLPY